MVKNALVARIARPAREIARDVVALAAAKKEEGLIQNTVSTLPKRGAIYIHNNHLELVNKCFL